MDAVLRYCTEGNLEVNFKVKTTKLESGILLLGYMIMEDIALITSTQVMVETIFMDLMKSVNPKNQISLKVR